MTPALSRAFIGEVTSWTWLEDTGAGLVAFVLVAHPGNAEFQMRGLAAALRLAPPRERLPYIGERVSVGGADRAYLQPDGCDYSLRLAIGTPWASFAATGGPIAVLVGLDPLPATGTRRHVDAYIRTRSLRLRLGHATATLAPPPPAA